MSANGPFPCACGGVATLVLLVTVPMPMGLAVESFWACEQHETALYLAADKADELMFACCICTPSEFPQELADLRLMLSDVARDQGVLLDVVEVPANTTYGRSRAERRASAPGRHRQRRSRPVASRQRPKFQGPQTA